MVEFSERDVADLREYRSLSTLSVYGTLGLITLNNDVFLCVVSKASRVATVKPGESVHQIQSVEFRTSACSRPLRSLRTISITYKDMC